MLEDIKKSYVNSASVIKDWDKMDKNMLANLYIKNEKDEALRNAYFSALMCRYWSNIGKYYNDSKNSVSIEECYDWLIHAITYALQNRKWTDPTSAMYKDKNGPDKVINRCIASTRQIFYQASNSAKRKINFQMDSIERQIESFGDSADALSVCEDDTSKVSSIDSIIEVLLKNNEVIEAIIVDNIAYQDAFKETKSKEESEFLNEFGEYESEEYYKYSYMFDERKLVKQLTGLNNYYLNYFCDKYEFDKELCSLYLEKLKNTSNTVIYRYIRKTLYDLKNRKGLKEILC